MLLLNINSSDLCHNLTDNSKNVTLAKTKWLVSIYDADMFIFVDLSQDPSSWLSTQIYLNYG